MIIKLIGCKQSVLNEKNNKIDSKTISEIGAFISLSEALMSKEDSIAKVVQYLDSVYQLSLEIDYNDGLVQSAYKLG